MNLFAAIAGWFLAQGIKAANWLLQDIGTGRGEVAEHPDELPPCGMRIVLTEEQVAASIADLERQFPNRDRRAR